MMNTQTLPLMAAALLSAAPAFAQVPSSAAPLAPAVPAAQTAPSSYSELRRSQPYALDMRAVYAFNAAPDSAYADDMAGISVEGAWRFAPHQALTLELKCMGVSHEEHSLVSSTSGWLPYNSGYSRTDFSLMPGYRVDLPLGRYVSFSAGVKAGLSVQHFSIDDNYGGWRYYGDDWDDTDVAAGFAYAASADFVFHVSPRVDLLAGYQYYGSTAKPAINAFYAGEGGYKCKTMRWHEARLGVRVNF